MHKILFAEDENKLRLAVKDYFTAKGFQVTTAKNGREAIEKTENGDFDLIILDVMMPEADGITVCKTIRSFCSAPVIFMSALSEESNLLSGYAAGADDYIVKPFPLSVLYEKCMAVIRRQKGTDSENRLVISGITVDFMKRKAYINEKELSLSNKDFEIICYLISNKNTVLSRSIIISRIWGYDFDGDERVVDTHIKNIRKALGDKAETIKTAVGFGYSFEDKGEKNEKT